MIKLKDILNEITVNHPKTIRWTSPTGTPDEFINVVHQILGTIIKNKKQPGPTNEYWRAFTSGEGSWVVQNPKNPHVLLIYIPQNNMWFAPDNVEGQMKMTPLSKSGLDLMIKNWMV